jgi:hypothetical protein
MESQGKDDGVEPGSIFEGTRDTLPPSDESIQRRKSIEG